jgi:hypothetical protein
MAVKEDFTEEEWRTMQRGLTGSGMLVSFADADVRDGLAEAKALTRFLSLEHKDGRSQFVRELVDVRGSGFGATTSEQELEAETLASLRQAVATLEAKAPGELAAYRELVIDLSGNVAGARLGLQPSESAMIDKIHEALGGPPATDA